MCRNNSRGKGKLNKVNSRAMNKVKNRANNIGKVTRKGNVRETALNRAQHQSYHPMLRKLPPRGRDEDIILAYLLALL